MNRTRLAAVSLNEKLKTLDNDYICLLTEPYRFKSKIASLPQKSYLIPSPLTVENNRAIIVSNLELVEISNLCTEDSAAAILKGKTSSILIVSLYMNITKPVEQDFIKRILTYSKNKGLELVIGVDTNCHSQLFGDSTNKRGLDLEEIIIEAGLVVENLGTEPTYETIRGEKLIQTCIDATLSRNIDGKITNWEVNREYNGSDHNTITFTLNYIQEAIKAERNWDKGEWTLLKPLLEEEDYYEPDIVTEKKLDQCLYQLYKKLYKALDKVCPKKKRRTKIKANPWYNKTLKAVSYTHLTLPTIYSV